MDFLRYLITSKLAHVKKKIISQILIFECHIQYVLSTHAIQIFYIILYYYYFVEKNPHNSSDKLNLKLVHA
jgi:predicted membrane protein